MEPSRGGLGDLDPGPTPDGRMGKRKLNIPDIFLILFFLLLFGAIVQREKFFSVQCLKFCSQQSCKTKVAFGSGSARPRGPSLLHRSWTYEIFSTSTSSEGSVGRSRKFFPLPRLKTEPQMEKNQIGFVHFWENLPRRRKDTFIIFCLRVQSLIKVFGWRKDSMYSG